MWWTLELLRGGFSRCCLRLFEDAPRAVFRVSRVDSQRLTSLHVEVGIQIPINSYKFPRQFELWEHLDVTKELCISAAGAIYVEQGSFTQSGGTLTITDASAGSDGGAVRMLRNPFILAVLSRGFPCWVTSWIFSESFCRHPMQSIVLCFQTEAET